MDKTTSLGVAAAISALVALPAASYADLLEPIPNAVERLKIADAQEAPQARLIEAQYAPAEPPVVAHHHHHHHHHHWRRHRRHYYHHHHHHHHHHSSY
jgi:G3E family GTPase